MHLKQARIQAWLNVQYLEGPKKDFRKDLERLVSMGKIHDIEQHIGWPAML